MKIMPYTFAYSDGKTSTFDVPLTEETYSQIHHLPNVKISSIVPDEDGETIVFSYHDDENITGGTYLIYQPYTDEFQHYHSNDGFDKALYWFCGATLFIFIAGLFLI